MPATDQIHDLEVLVRSRYGLIVLETPEEDRAQSLLRLLADHVQVPFFVWSRTKGLGREDADQPVYRTTDPINALSHVEQAAIPAIWHFRDFGPFLKDPAVRSALHDAIRIYERQKGSIFLTGTDIELPESLETHAAVDSLGEPSDEDFRNLLANILRDLNQRAPVDIDLNMDELERLYANLRGLTLVEAEKILTKAIVEDGKLHAADIHKVLDHKRKIIEREGLLEYYPADAALTDIADLVGLKRWLRKRSAIIEDPKRAEEFGLEFPKGMLLVGVPGCGKSLCAKAVAAEWKLPLLKLDPANLYNKFIGESERNFKRAVETAERMAPVVLWIDELEKAFAGGEGGGEDSGVSTRVLGGFLSWMQERKGDVFVVATANAVHQLRPEFLRKGRFDEIFFVDLPDPETRREIFRIHLRNREQDPADFDLDALALASDGFSGAEIEQVILSGLYTAFSRDGALSTDTLLHEIEGTHPLATTMHERIASLRDWARGRTVSAH